MSDPIKYLFRFLLFVVVQALVLDHVEPLHRFLSPIVYFQFLLWLPFSISRQWLLVLGFLLGFALDMFSNSPGLHASACLWVAYIRAPLVALLVPSDTRELKTGAPGIYSMGLPSYALFMFILTFFIGDFVYFLGKVFFSSLLSMVLMFMVELLFRPLRKRRIG
jgi:hypothetical protein